MQSSFSSLVYHQDNMNEDAAILHMKFVSPIPTSATWVLCFYVHQIRIYMHTVLCMCVHVSYKEVKANFPTFIGDYNPPHLKIDINKPNSKFGK